MRNFRQRNSPGLRRSVRIIRAFEFISMGRDWAALFQPFSAKTTQFLCALTGLCLLLPAFSLAIEPWGDDRLPIQDDGLELWLDCSRQNAARTASQLPPLGSGNSVDYLIDGSGRSRNLAQHRIEARPRFQQAF